MKWNLCFSSLKIRLMETRNGINFTSTKKFLPLFVAIIISAIFLSSCVPIEEPKPEKPTPVTEPELEPELEPEPEPRAEPKPKPEPEPESTYASVLPKVGVLNQIPKTNIKTPKKEEVITPTKKTKAIIIDTGSLGEISEVRKIILEKTFESKLDDYFAIVPKELFEEAQEQAFEELDYDECTEDQCIRMIQELLQVENAFKMDLMYEEGDTQISITWNDQDQKRVEEDYCEGCKTKELRNMIGGLVKKLVGVKDVVKEEPPKKVEPKVVEIPKKVEEPVVQKTDQIVLYGKLVKDKRNPSKSVTKWFSYGNDKTDQKYVGETKNGLPNGKGTQTFPNGDKYIGEFWNGKRHGQGTIYWTNGNKVVGEFQNNEYLDVIIYDSNGNEISRVVK